MDPRSGIELTELDSQDEDLRRFAVELEPGSGFFDGHFPDRPVLPGAAILLLVAEAVHRIDRSSPATGFDRVRFLAPVEPTTAPLLTLRADPRGSGLWFELHDGDALLATGRVTRSETGVPPGRSPAR